MKTVKPLKLGVLCRTYERERAPHLAIGVVAFFTLGAPSRLLTELALWRFLAEVQGDRPIDAAIDKARGELLVHGACHQPGGVPHPMTTVGVRCGTVKKTLRVFGERVWKDGAATEPEPFVTMPISYERAFGGPGYPANPLGKGAAALESSEPDGVQLPNIESTVEPLTEPSSRPELPAGFGPVELAWPQRAAKGGTYDEAWLRDAAPGFPDDLDWTMFNEAPADQQLDGFFEGDEAFRLENLHPDLPVIDGRLPGIVARCFVELRGEPELRSVPMRLDTVHFFPGRERGVLVFRGVVRVTEDDATDVQALVVAAERLKQPKSLEHYVRVLAERRDRQRPELFLRDADLMPAPTPAEAAVPDEPLSDMEVLLAREGYVERNARRGAEREFAEKRADRALSGLDDADQVPVLPPPAKPLSLDELPAFIADMRVTAESERADAQARKEALAGESGAATIPAGGPPSFRAHDELERLRATQTLANHAGTTIPHVDAKLADPAFARRLAEVELRERETYRRLAHVQAPPAPISRERALELRAEVVMKVAAGLPMEACDLTGADLSGLDLAHADLRGAFLEGANFSGATLTGANLERAVLARVNFVGVVLTGAWLRDANLGYANFAGASVDSADLTGAVLVDADFADGDFTGARLEKCDITRARLHAANLEGVFARELIFDKTQFRGARLSRADLTKASFLEADLTGADLTGATLTSALFLGVRAERVKLTGAIADNLRVVEKSSLASAVLTGADLRGANLRGTCLLGAYLERADLTGADLSECDLSDATLEGACAVEARFTRATLARADFSGADLMMATLAAADVGAADFEGANLFGADLARMRANESTILDGANVKRTRVLPARAPRE